MKDFLLEQLGNFAFGIGFVLGIALFVLIVNAING